MVLASLAEAPVESAVLRLHKTGIRNGATGVLLSAAKGRSTEQEPPVSNTSAGLPEKPKPPGKPADTLTQARRGGR